VQSLNRVYFNFANSLKSLETRRKYEYNLRKFLISNKIRIEEFVSLPVFDIENMLIDYIAKMKNEQLSTSYINTTLAAIKHLCVMNDVRINKEKIGKFVGECTKLHEDRPYTHEEILQLLNVCDLRMRTLVLLLASTGMRIGALPTLKVSDLDLDQSGGKVKVYSGTPDEYITFMTPECSKAVNHYLEFRNRSGEKITDDSPVIREQFVIFMENNHF